MIEKKCDVTGQVMGANEIDFAGNMQNQVQLETKVGEQGVIVVFGFKKRGQFSTEDLHISREGAEKLLLEAAENLPAKHPKPVVNAPETVSVPKEGTAAPETATPTKKTGATLNRE